MWRAGPGGAGGGWRDRRALRGERGVPRGVGTPTPPGARAVLRGELAGGGFVVRERGLGARPRPPLWGPGPAEATNLIAVRPRARVLTWLAAHYDSKRQPISMAARLVLAATLVVALLAASVTLLAGGSTLILAVPVGGAARFPGLKRVSAGFPRPVGNLSGGLEVLATVDAL